MQLGDEWLLVLAFGQRGRAAVEGLDAVVIATAQLGGVHAETLRGTRHRVLDDEHPLRPAEPAKRRVRGGVGAHGPALEAQVGDVVGVGGVEQRAVEDRRGEVDAPAAVGVGEDLERADAAVGGEASPVARPERVTLACHLHVELAAEPDLDRTVERASSQRGEGGEVGRLRLLAPEGAAHAWDQDDDAAVVAAEDLGGGVLDLGRVLRGGVDLERTILAGDRQRGMGLEVEVVLAAAGELALDAQRGAGQSSVDVSAAHAMRRAQVRLCRDRVGDREDRRRLLDVDLQPHRSRATDRHRLADDQRDQLTDRVELAFGEQWFVVHDRAEAVVARDVAGEQHRVHAGHRLHGGAVDREQLATRDRRADRQADQQTLGTRQVIDITRGAGNVAVGALVAGRAVERAVGRCVAHGRTSRCTVPDGRWDRLGIRVCWVSSTKPRIRLPATTPRYQAEPRRSSIGRKSRSSAGKAASIWSIDHVLPTRAASSRRARAGVAAMPP